ncbi:hypothetical protein [Altererythrobacter sp. MF3-039]|uniref:hypothetical protein n=1 Tax=Altererythrobacter sp. MF3-039 TaxID=3252901 RepID=UPI00390CCAFD
MSSPRTVTFGSVIFVSLLAVYAFLALGSGMDRLSAQDPSRASLVPEILSAQAAQAEAALALAQSDYRGAESHAIRALQASPREPRVLGLLASAQLLRGDTWAAHRGFSVARSGGWRDPVTQSYWANDQLSRGKPQEAIRHLEALLRAQPYLAAGEQLLLAIAQDQSARTALLERLKTHEPLATAVFAVEGTDLSSAVALRGELLLDPQMETQPYGCAIAGSVIEGLAERQMSDRADAVAAQHCPI